MDSAPGLVAIHEPGAAGLPLNDAVESRAVAAETEAFSPKNVLKRPAARNIECTCWPLSGEGLAPPEALDQILFDLWKPFQTAIRAFNQVIQCARMYRFHQIHLPEYNLQPLHKMAISTGSLVTISLIDALTIVSDAPGYILSKPQCRNSFEEHLECLARRDETLRVREETLKNATVEAQPLFDAYQTFLKREAERRRQKSVHVAVRAAAIVTLPFMPILSAVLNAVDVLGLAVYNGVQEVISGSGDDIRPLSADIDALQKMLHEKIAATQGLRRELVAIREKVEWQRNDPSTARLSAIQRKLRVAASISCHALWDESSAVAMGTRSLRQVAHAIREVLDVLGDPPEGTDPLVDLDDSQWLEMDQAIAEIGRLMRSS